MTDETTILLEMLAIQLFTSKPRRYREWLALDERVKQDYRDRACKWFENNRAIGPPVECMTCGEVLTKPGDTCRCGITRGTIYLS